MTDEDLVEKDIRELPVPSKDDAIRVEALELPSPPDEPMTPKKVFDLAIDLLHVMGYECMSEDRIEDFTGRIDGVLRKQNSFGDREHSGYLRILSVYRSGQKIHVEFYNFLTKFPADSVEMQEVSESLKTLFEKEESIILEIHE